MVGLTQYRELAEHITDRSLYGLIAKELESDNYINRIRNMAIDHIKDIRSVQPTGPYNLGGFCFGGLVAFEMARILSSEGEKVDFLGLFDTRAPQQWNRQQKSKLSARFSKMSVLVRSEGMSALLSWARSRYAYERNRFKEVVKRVVGRLYMKLGVPVPIRFRGAIRGPHDAESALRYRPEPYEGAVVLFQSEGDFRDHDSADPAWGWHDMALGGVDCVRLPGTHGDFFGSYHAKILSDKILEKLDK
jgi:thioesterase domain-containing protein